MKRKARLYLNGMFYGDLKTKFVLWTVVVATAAAIGLILIGAATVKIPFLLAGVIFAIVALVAAQSVDFDHIEIDEAAMAADQQEEKPKEKKTVMSVDASIEETEPETEEELRRKEQLKAKKEHVKKEQAAVDALKEALERIDQKQLKKMFYSYKVKKNHRPVMIDSCASYKIKECPAYAWTHRGLFHLLLMEKTPRKITLPIYEVSKITYEKGVYANPKTEYSALDGNSMISVAFRNYIPTYYEVKRSDGTKTVKNLYVLGKGIKFTNTSAKEIVALLNPEFEVQDSVTNSEDYNRFFKDIYKLRIMLNDGVLNIKEYQFKIKFILEQLAQADLPEATFRYTLSDMMRYQLITSEYYTYYTQFHKSFHETKKKHSL